MTNLEWIRTLSEEEFADWLYDEWLHHLQYRWSSSRGGLIIWLTDRKTENSSEKPNNCEHITEDGVTCAKYPACDDCLNNPLNKVKGSERLLKGKTEPTISKMEQVAKDINVRSKDEPKLSEIPTSKCHYEPKADGILFKGNLKEGDYKLIKTSNGWVLEGNDIAYCGEPQTESTGSPIGDYRDGVGAWQTERMTEEEIDTMLAKALVGQTDCPWR